MECFAQENIAKITGALDGELKADHVMRSETIYTGRIVVMRSSGTPDILPLSVPGRLMDGFSGEGAVSLRAQIRSYSMREGEKNHLALTLFARFIGDAAPDAPDENEIGLAGTLAKKAVFRTTPFMREIADMLVEVNRAFGRSDYIPCIAWGRDAHLAAELEPGARIRLTGRMQSREYIKRFPGGAEETRTAYEVSCRTLEIF